MARQWPDAVPLFSAITHADLKCRESWPLRKSRYQARDEFVLGHKSRNPSIGEKKEIRYYDLMFGACPRLCPDTRPSKFCRDRPGLRLSTTTARLRPGTGSL